MICEKCGHSMQWRCTDTRTRLAKYKCLGCGELIIVEDDYEAPEIPVRVPKYYYCSKGRFIVHKKIDGKFVNFGTYADEETAKAVVDKMKEFDWDKDMLHRVYDELGMKYVNRLWVCA